MHSRHWFSKEDIVHKVVWVGVGPTARHVGGNLTARLPLLEKRLKRALALVKFGLLSANSKAWFQFGSQKKTNNGPKFCLGWSWARNSAKTTSADKEMGIATYLERSTEFFANSINCIISRDGRSSSSSWSWTVPRQVSAAFACIFGIRSINVANGILDLMSYRTFPPFFAPEFNSLKLMNIAYDTNSVASILFWGSIFNATLNFFCDYFCIVGLGTWHQKALKTCERTILFLFLTPIYSY